MKVRDCHFNIATGQMEERWLDMPHVVSAEDALAAEKADHAAQAAKQAEHDAVRAKVAALKDHHDPAIAFLADQLLTKL